MNAMPQITADSLIAILDATHTGFKTIIDSLDITAPAPAPGEWDARQVLSHIIGAYQRAPINAGRFVAGDPGVQILLGNPFWLPEYEGAPKESFAGALSATVEGNKAFIRGLNPADLWKSLPLPGYGDTPLAVFLLVNFQNHVNEQHVPQLRAFVPALVAPERVTAMLVTA